MQAVIYKDNNLLYPIFSGLKTSFTDINGKRYRVYRKIITDANDISITTTNSDELKQLVTLISSAFLTIGLEISQFKTQLFHYDLYNKVKFDLFGFTFYYLPYGKHKKGGIIARSDVLNKKSLKSNTTGGSHFIYPSNKSFNKIKFAVKSEIETLRHKTIFEVIRNVNSIIGSWVNYFA